MKLGLVTLAILAMTGVAHAEQENSLKKILDGTARYCATAADAKTEMNVKMALRGSVLSIELVKCEADKDGSGRYVPDTSVAERSFKAVNGEIVQERYSNFELVLLDKNSNIIEIHTLNDLGLTSHEVLNLEKLERGTELLVRAIYSYQSETGISDRRIMAWGSFRY
ncbi:hypothetical protein [Bdellovibrio svalbardensis]|uniref:Uncharacterized protein n=1 Tax=Bdellovibrio svalbardensis TaxID=2972972 RepID=A0ABT6DMC5_9BACT|nr:hypothetical protein [Bdellovibrio svalbardensis]MDG0817948.1 hypothetical protein [Bdellovibrio svalbardensis]